MAIKIKLEDIRAPSTVLCCAYLPKDNTSYPSRIYSHKQDSLFQKLFGFRNEARSLDD